MCLQWAGRLCGSVTMITRNCLHRSHQTGFVGKSRDHLQLIKFWPSCAPGKRVCGGAKNFGSTLLQPVCSVCVSLSIFFICILREGAIFQFQGWEPSAVRCFRTPTCTHTSWPRTTKFSMLTYMWWDVFLYDQSSCPTTGCGLALPNF